MFLGASLLHKNTIESLCHQLKLITDNFFRISIEKLNECFINDNDNTAIMNYLDGYAMAY